MIRNVICLVSRSEGNVRHSLTDWTVIESQIPFYIMFTLAYNEIKLECIDFAVEKYGINLICQNVLISPNYLMACFSLIADRYAFTQQQCPEVQDDERCC